MRNVEKLKRAQAAHKAAKRHIFSVLRDEYPVGADVFWRRHGLVYQGTVTRLAYPDKVEVRIGGYGELLWLEAGRIVS